MNLQASTATPVTCLQRSPPKSLKNSTWSPSKFQDNMEEEFEPLPPLLSQSINDEPQQQEQNEDEDHEDDDDEDDNEDDFEFVVVGKDSDLSPIPADKIFDNGQIRPVFLIFNCALLFADGAKSDFKPNDNPPCSSSSEDELKGISDEISSFTHPF